MTLQEASFPLISIITTRPDDTSLAFLVPSSGSYELLAGPGGMASLPIHITP
jgi:hypothetical protein